MLTDLQITQITSLANGLPIYKAKKDEFLEITEFDKDTVVTLISKRLTKNFLVAFEALLFIDGKKYKFSVTGKISNITSTPENSFSTEIEMHHFDHDLWNKFIDCNLENQSKIDKVLQKMKDF